MPDPVVNIYLYPAGEPVTGLWCDVCAKPSVIEQVFVAGLGHPLEPPFDPDGPCTLRPRFCTDCGWTTESSIEFDDGTTVEINHAPDDEGG